MKEYRDASNRLSISLSDRVDDFDFFAERMIALHGEPVEKTRGLDQVYWDFDVDGVTVVLHSEHFLGVSTHVEDGTHEKLLREIARQLTDNGLQNNTSGHSSGGRMDPSPEQS